MAISTSWRCRTDRRAVSVSRSGFRSTVSRRRRLMSNAAGLKVLIVDDERPARQKLRRLLGSDTEVVAIYEAADGVAAIETIRNEAPDVVFLDVQMSGVDGF